MAQTRDLMQALIARLTAQVPGVAVDWYPVRPDEYRLNHPVGAVLVGFAGASRDSDSLPAADRQPRSIKISLTIYARSLTHPDGVVDWLDACRAALLGWSPVEDGRVLIYESEAPLFQAAGIWTFEQLWSARDLVRPIHD